MNNLSNTHKQILINLVALLTMTLIAGYAPFSLAKVNSEEKFYTEEGYPYGPLVQRLDSVKIRYSELGNKQVQCSAELKDHTQTWSSNVRLVSEKKFNKAPLKACLERELAKRILAGTFL